MTKIKDLPEEKAMQMAAEDPNRFVAALLIEMNGFMDQKTVEAITTLSHAEIHRRQRRGTFPKKIAIGGTRRGYRARDIQRWLEAPEAWSPDPNANV